MNTPKATPQTMFFVKRGDEELGPFTIPQLNKMRAEGELTADAPCRAADSVDFTPLATRFPHLRDFVRKSAAEHQREARLIEGNGVANTAFGCAVMSLFFGGPILAAFGIVLGIKSYLRAYRIIGLFAALIGTLSFMFQMARFFKLLPEE
jgi:GYF domain 2